MTERQKDKVLFLSDAHLGSGDDSPLRERQLCTLIERLRHQCSTVVLLGDMFDFWFSYRHLVPRGGVRLLGKLADLADSGTQIVYFVGNHDMWLFDYLERECGATMYDQPAMLTFGNCRILAGHGDGLGHLDHKYDLMKAIFRSHINQRLFALLPAGLTFPIARRWSDSNKRRHALKDTAHYMGDDREGIVIYCRQRIATEPADYCVFGHRHTPLEMSIAEGCTYINTGDWLTNRTYALFDPTDSSLRLHDAAAEGLIAGID